MNGRDPETPTEWQEAVDGAQFMLLMHAAVCYGLIEWKGDVDVDRCDDILRRGRALGFAPARTDDLIKRFISR
jgi:hypothetical protein